MELNFILCYDKNLIKPAFKLIRDIAKFHDNGENFINIHILSYDFNTEYYDNINLDLLKLGYKNTKIFGYKLDENELSTFTTPDYISKITNYRYYMFSLPIKEKALYLDIDIQILKPLTEWFKLDFDNKIIGSTYDKIGAIKIVNGEYYFSSGVMFIDFKNVKNGFDITKQLIDFHKTCPNHPNADQWVLNNVLKEKHLRLFDNLEYMISEHCFKTAYNIEQSNVEDYYIIHYNIPDKPYILTLNSIFMLPMKEYYK